MLGTYSESTVSLGWFTKARCLNMDPAIFFPSDADTEGHDRAKSICLVCPVKWECLDYAIDQKLDYGIFGGLSERERRLFIRRNKKRFEKDGRLETIRRLI